MSKELLVPLITGLFGAVIAPIITQVVIPLIKTWAGLDGQGATVKKRKGNIGSDKPRRSRSSFWHAAIGGVVGILLGYLLMPIIPPMCPPFSPTKVNITSPAVNSEVPRLITVQGTICHIPSERELWLLVVPEGVTAYYPQTGPVVISNDNWSASAYVGIDTDNGKGFLVIAALTDQQGSAAMHRYFSQTQTSFTGLKSLPSGTQIKAQVRVVRR